MPKSYYPPRTLKEALVIPRAIYEKNGGNPMFRLTLATEVGHSPSSSTFRALITASSGYGMTTGSYKAEKIELEPLGIEIVEGNAAAVFTALFSNEVFQGFYEFFGTGGGKSIPSEKAASDFLRDKFGIPEKQINGILQNILANARDWLLIQDIAGGERFVPKELAMKNLTERFGQPLQPSKVTASVATSNIVKRDEKSAKPISAPAKATISPGLQLNIEIHISADTPEEKIEVIFKNMKKYLLADE